MQTRSISPVFVGRADELKTLRTALAGAAAGEPQMVLVGGEAGVGKSRLLEEFLEAAQTSGAVTAVGGCLELGAEGLPFAPFATVLRSLHRRIGGELAAAADGREAELARLLPELGPVAPEPHVQEGRARLFELTARVLERLAADRTVVLALEDLHWADRSTRELLGYLVRSLQGARLVVVMTYRSDDVHRRHPLRPFLAELDRLRRVERIELARLSRDEVRSQLAGIRGVVEPERELVAGIFERSEGNPFFVEELALSSEDAGRLSDSLRDLLLVRVEALPETAQRVVRIAARNTRVPHALLAVVSGLPEDELIEGLRAAVGASVLLPDEDGEAYRFRHALLREAVLDDLLPGERTRLSRRYAEALEADPGLVPADERAARLASYWYYARDAAKALPAVLVAVTETRERHAYAEQLKLLERAMELWDEVAAEQRRGLPVLGGLEAYPPCGCGDRADVLELHFVDLLAHAVFAGRLDGQPDPALKFVKKGLKLVDEQREPLRAAWFWLERSRLLAHAGRSDGRAELTRAHELVREQPATATHADVLAHVAQWELLHSSTDDTLALAERAVELARACGAEDVELGARITLASLRSRGDADAWVAELYEIRGLARRIGSPRELSRAHINLTDVLEKLGQSADAVELGLVGIEELRQRGLYDHAAFTAFNVAESLTMLGEYERSERLVQEWWRHAAGSRTRAAGELRRATLAEVRGEFHRVPDFVAASRAHRGGNDGEPQFELPLAAHEMTVAVPLGRIPQALRVLRDHLALLPLPGQETYVWHFLVAGARLAADVAGAPGTDEPERQELISRMASAAEEQPGDGSLWTPLARLFAAELSRARGENDPSAWAAAAAAYAPLAHPHPQAAIAHRWAEALLAAGGGEERARAAGLLPEAYETAVRLGAAPLRTEIELLAGRARIPLDADAAAARAAARAPADPAEGLGLTARESEVLRLVAAGRSNREIAGELFITAKTASVHVSNMMAKLGVSSRGEAAALAHRMRLFETA